jgi:hypothetical protein
VQFPLRGSKRWLAIHVACTCGYLEVISADRGAPLAQQSDFSPVVDRNDGYRTWMANYLSIETLGRTLNGSAKNVKNIRRMNQLFVNDGELPHR